MKLVPFGVVLGQDDREALVELIEARWRDGKSPGPVLGRRGHNHMHEEIENYNWLEILWVAAPPKGDYYDGEYDSEAYAHPRLTNLEPVGADYYTNVWKDLATTEQTLSRLRAEVSTPICALQTQVCSHTLRNPPRTIRAAFSILASPGLISRCRVRAKCSGSPKPWRNCARRQGLRTGHDGLRTRRPMSSRKECGRSERTLTVNFSSVLRAANL
jgi:hypothetical protein